ncbi:copper resistance protein NlpE [Sinomicrobium kalidii]|uniref:copper resistance protein NlpE n=1 Tax=Sinomicrobium kalidii TaxID=2900738 RepID=UPI001E3EE89F|nr:copper resistance protein NlpE [Sinomicrobium kalidii]UGU18022.1 copper resistance protein NlpE [Sinomicrobium kalidii]
MKKVILSAVVVMGVTVLLTSCKHKEKPAKENESTEQVSEEPAVTDMHNAANSLDFEGVYEGTVPCADCEGIKMTVTINEDHSFKEVYEYLGVEKENTFSDEGTWEIQESTITFRPKEGDNKRMYFVGEGFIQALDQEGNKIDGDMAEMYILKKTE